MGLFFYILHFETDETFGTESNVKQINCFYSWLQGGSWEQEGSARVGSPEVSTGMIPNFTLNLIVKILIIEDEKVLSESIATYLRGELYVCETASDYETALKKTES